MAGKFISMRNLQFLLYEHLDSVALTQSGQSALVLIRAVIEPARTGQREMSSQQEV